MCTHREQYFLERFKIKNNSFFLAQSSHFSAIKRCSQMVNVARHNVPHKKLFSYFSAENENIAERRKKSLRTPCFYFHFLARLIPLLVLPQLSSTFFPILVLAATIMHFFLHIFSPCIQNKPRAHLYLRGR